MYPLKKELNINTSGEHPQVLKKIEKRTNRYKDMSAEAMIVKATVQNVLALPAKCQPVLLVLYRRELKSLMAPR